MYNADTIKLVVRSYNRKRVAVRAGITHKPIKAVVQSKKRLQVNA